MADGTVELPKGVCVLGVQRDVKGLDGVLEL